VAGGGGILDAQRQVTWQRGGREQTGGGVLDARHRVTWQSGGQWQAGPASMLFERPTSFEGGARVMDVGDEGRWLDLEEIESE
jgi:hypothetical protein